MHVNLFYSSSVAQVLLSNVTPAPPPFLSSVHFNPLITSTAPPLPHIRFGKSGPCVYGQTGHHLAVIPARIPL